MNNRQMAEALGYPPAGTDIDDQMKWMMAEIAMLRRENKEARAVLEAMTVTFEDTVERFERRVASGRGGQQVPDFGEFNNVPPSTIGRFRWWAREMRSVLNGTNQWWGTPDWEAMQPKDK